MEKGFAVSPPIGACFPACYDLSDDGDFESFRHRFRQLHAERILKLCRAQSLPLKHLVKNPFKTLSEINFTKCFKGNCNSKLCYLQQDASAFLKRIAN